MTLLALTLTPLTASLIAFIGVSGLLGALFMLLDGNGSSNVESRLDVLAGKKPAKAEGTQVTRETLVKEGVNGLTGAVGKLMERFSNLKLLFVQADTTIKLDHFMLIMAICGVVGVVLGMVGNVPAPVYPLCALGGSLMPFGWLMFKRGRRFKKFAKQLPDAMELIGRALRSGHSLASAMKVVVDELPDPISKEFNIAYEEQNLGIPLEQALKNLYLRMPNMDYKFFAMAVAIQRQSGGDLAEILDKIGHIIRERIRILGQVQALTGEGRISGIVLMALPILLFFAVWKLNPDYVMLLFTDELGRQMVAVAIVLQILGAVTIKKIITIKV
ncbi:type II secretion system F family protein [Planctomicrobium piriforme]|uniref:Tight adherence protein B n=1 Tax=Planctomicrobium piriforme TaxID=1576369 RepID=A0A1I3BG09_9PLAN|nr:type II secretion system F family protein [Planctomicrobium piriforme]SFH60879.1 tight adherence protein B [Planctomicrobium piriforme]